MVKEMAKSAREQYEELKLAHDQNDYAKIKSFLADEDGKKNRVSFIFYAADGEAILFFDYLLESASEEEKTAALMQAINCGSVVAMGLLLEQSAKLNDASLPEIFNELLASRCAPVLHALVKALPKMQRDQLIHVLKIDQYNQLGLSVNADDIAMVILLLKCGASPNDLYGALNHEKFAAAAWLLLYGATVEEREGDLIYLYKEPLSREIIKIAEEAVISFDEEIRTRCLSFFKNRIGMKEQIPGSILSKQFHAHRSWMGWTLSSIWSAGSITRFRQLYEELKKSLPDYELLTSSEMTEKDPMPTP